MSKATEKWIEHISEAMAAIDALDVTERQRVTIRRALAHALVEAEDTLLEEYENRNAGKPWSTAEIAVLKEALEPMPLCDSWATERATLTMCSERVGRPEKMVKKKAIELGLAAKVDYWMNNKNR